MRLRESQRDYVTMIDCLKVVHINFVHQYSSYATNDGILPNRMWEGRTRYDLCGDITTQAHRV